MKRSIALILFACIFLPLTACFAQSSEADAIVGTWLVQDKKAKVEIFKRGEKYFGKIIWLKEPNDESGKAKTDKENPDKALRSKPILGLEMLRDFVYDEDFEWDDGEIYDPKNGKTYSCTMTLSKDRNTLDVRGYIGISLIGRTQLWTRTKD
ncbi:MAG: DUF2147 domain-containing protein [Bacteroidia bacterium]|nr:DUF2147 domain-containing protein [Bacteroidia bacterium]